MAGLAMLAFIACGDDGGVCSDPNPPHTLCGGESLIDAVPLGLCAPPLYGESYSGIIFSQSLCFTCVNESYLHTMDPWVTELCPRDRCLNYECPEQREVREYLGL